MYSSRIFVVKAGYKNLEVVVLDDGRNDGSSWTEEDVYYHTIQQSPEMTDRHPEVLLDLTIYRKCMFKITMELPVAPFAFLQSKEH